MTDIGWNALFTVPAVKQTSGPKRPSAEQYLSNPARYPQITNAIHTRAFGLPNPQPEIAPRAHRGQVPPVERIFEPFVPPAGIADARADPMPEPNSEVFAPGVSVSALAVRPPGMVEPGNINLSTRPVVRNANGSISTVRSITIEQDGRAILIPTVVGNAVVSDKDAIEHFRQTGEHLGIFQNEQAADRYAQQLHEDQAREYGPRQIRRSSSSPAHGVEPPDASYTLSNDYLAHRPFRGATAHYTTQQLANGSSVRTSDVTFEPVPEAPESERVPLPPTIGWSAMFTRNDPEWVAAQRRARQQIAQEQDARIQDRRAGLLMGPFAK